MRKSIVWAVVCLLALIGLYACGGGGGGGGTTPVAATNVSGAWGYGNRILIMTSDNKFVSTLAGSNEANGTYSVSGNQVTFNDQGGSAVCGAAGAYTVNIVSNTLSFTTASDSCAGRVSVLTSTTWTKKSDSTFNIPTASITVDGSASDWASITPYITDVTNDNNSVSGADLFTMYLARDTTYLYGLIVLSGNTSPNQNLHYHLRYSLGNDRAIKIEYSGGQWTLFRSFQGSTVETYPSSNLAILGERMEFKVPLSSVQADMNGTSYFGGGALFAAYDFTSHIDVDLAIGVAMIF